MTLMSSLSSYLTGYALRSRIGWSPRTLAFALGVLFCIPGLLWLLILSRWQAPADEQAAPRPATASAAEEALDGRIG